MTKPSNKEKLDKLTEVNVEVNKKIDLLLASKKESSSVKVAQPTQGQVLLGDVTLILGGDTATQQFTLGGLDGNNNTIPNIADPVNDGDVTPKLWVENQIANAEYSVTTLLETESTQPLQQPSATNTLENIQLGPITLTPSITLTKFDVGDVEASVITFLEAGIYSITVRYNLTRNIPAAQLPFLPILPFVNDVQLGSHGNIYQITTDQTLTQSLAMNNITFAVNDKLEIKYGYTTSAPAFIRAIDVSAEFTEVTLPIPCVSIIINKLG